MVKTGTRVKNKRGETYGNEKKWNEIIEKSSGRVKEVGSRTLSESCVLLFLFRENIYFPCGNFRWKRVKIDSIDRKSSLQILFNAEINGNFSRRRFKQICVLIEVYFTFLDEALNSTSDKPYLEKICTISKGVSCSFLLLFLWRRSDKIGLSVFQFRINHVGKLNNLHVTSYRTLFSFGKALDASTTSSR